MTVGQTLERVRSSISWLDFMVPCCSAMGGLTSCLRSIQRDLGVAGVSHETHVRQVRLELTQGAINAARSYLDDLELATVQALEEARRA